MSWLFSQAMVEEYSAGTSWDGELSAQLNVMPTPHLFWRNDKTMDCSRLSRFGLTLKVFPESRGEELLMSFLEASLARTSASPEAGKDLTESDQDCGKSLTGLFAIYDLESCLWRTAQCSLLEDSELFSETWPRSGTTVNGKSYLRQMSVHPTYESVSGYWPTPTVCGNHNMPGSSATSGLGLSSAVKLYPTVCARDHRYPGKSRMERTGGKHGEVLPQIVGGPLNPLWVEWLMGWPIGWTELRVLATGKFQEWQQQHSISSPSEPELSEAAA